MKFQWDNIEKTWKYMAPDHYEAKMLVYQKATDWWSRADLADVYTEPNWSFIYYKFIDGTTDSQIVTLLSTILN
jgi:hypothetical protein